MLTYLKRRNVIIVKDKPIDDNNKPVNVIIESTCSTAFGIGFCSISLNKKR
jgi:hypothetical protein